MAPRWIARDRALVVAAAVLAALVFAVSWYRHATFRSTTYDLGVFEQALWKMAHGHAPFVTPIGWNIFADHGSPVLLFFVPLYRIAATPLWLFAAQGIAVALGLLALPPLLDACHVTNVTLRRAFIISYVVSPLLWNATLYDFHPTTLAFPILLIGLTAALRDRVGVVLAASAGLLLLRDDLGAAVGGLALIGITALPRRRQLLRVALAAGGVAWAVAGSALGKAWGADRNWHFHYGYLGRSASAVLTHPFRTIPRAIDKLPHLDNHQLLLAWLIGFALLPLLRPARFAAVLVLALPLFLSAGVQFHSPHFHYGAPLLPFLLLAAATGIDRLPRAVATRPHFVAAALVLGTLATFVRWGPPDTHTLTRPVARAADIRRALHRIRPTDNVVAGFNLGAHLAHRRSLLPFPAPFTQGRHDFPLKASVRHVSAARVARIDAVIVDRHELKHTRRAFAAFLASPYLVGFHHYQYGDVLLWLRR